jgi:hypothetical protein
MVAAVSGLAAVQQRSAVAIEFFSISAAMVARLQHAVSSIARLDVGQCTRLINAKDQLVETLQGPRPSR